MQKPTRNAALRKRERISLLKSKKGTIFDTFAIMTFALVFVIVSIIGFKLYNEFNNSGAITSATGLNVMSTSGNVYGLLDTLFVFLLVGLGITAIIAAVRIRTSPAFFFMTILVFAVVIFLAAQISNVFEIFSGHAEFATEVATFTKSTTVMDRLPFFMLGLGALIIVVMYAVNKFEV